MKCLKKLIVLILLVLTCVATFRNRRQAVKKPNVEYIFKGYNAIFGNPHSSGVDRGFKAYLFKLTYKGVESETDILPPKGTDIVETSSCDDSSNTSTISGAESYQRALSADVSVGGGIGPISFTASAGFKDVEEETKNSKNFYKEEKATCSMYTISMRKHNAPELTADAIKVLKKLPAYPQKKASYCSFFEEFGTHCIEELTLGTRYGRLLKYNSSSQSRGKETGYSFGVSASVAVVSASAKTEGNFKTGNSNESQVRNEKSFSIGSAPGESINDWYKKRDTVKPMPIIYKVIPINECLEWENVKDQLQKAKVTSQVASNIEKALANYCKDCLVPKILTTCEPPKDPTPIKVEKVKMEERKFYRLKNLETDMCIQGFGEKDSIRLFACNPKNASQCWKFESRGDYMLLNKANNNAMDQMSNTGENTEIILYGQRGNSHQKYYIDIDEETGGYTIKSRHSNKCLMPQNSSRGPNTLLVQFSCTERADQKWILEPCTARK